MHIRYLTEKNRGEIMKIGEFAKACGTKISVLRHYDSQGLLKPVFIDRFTEYRYYDVSQVAVFKRISEFKAVGFTLAQIRTMLYSDEHTDDIFSARRAALEKQLHDLDILRENGGTIMEQKFKPLIEDTNIPFVNDERVIGKWQVEGGTGTLGDWNKTVYFLPGGEFYWCYGWSKGKLIYDDGVSRFVNDYRLEERSGELYMIVSCKSQDYPVTGETTAIALRKLDSVHYTRDQISKKDDINKPFRDDRSVIGKWKAFCYFMPSELKRQDFIPFENPPKGSYNYLSEPYFKEIEFYEGGHVRAVYADDVITGDDKHTWTKGFWLRKWNSTACAYEIKEFGGKEYLIIEWKSGDYRFGGCPSDYYVMVKD